MRARHRPSPRIRAPERFTADAGTLNVALVPPMQGPAGLDRRCPWLSTLVDERTNGRGTRADAPGAHGP
ncbi:hypothetical protein FB570_110134 [Streptomyces sp. T12]|nr:hypothetical protein FB570_110134 [Streptomyces sp. T12]